MQLQQLRAVLLESATLAAPQLRQVRGDLSASAINLVQYLALRQRDQRALQEQLSASGLSSLGRSESHALAQVDAVLGLLAQLLGEERPGSDEAISASQGQALLHEHAERLLGPSPRKRRQRVMVTLPSEAAASPEYVQALVAAGMDIARINSAHDDPAAWRAMARNVRHASARLDRRCLIAVDLAGPKLRTGAIEPGPEVIKLKPTRNVWGEVLHPARAWLTSGPSALVPALPIRETFLDRLRVGDKLKLRDARGRRRKFVVESITDGAVEVSCDRTTYIRRGTRIHGADDAAMVGHLARCEQHILLKEGDLLALDRSGKPGHPARIHGASALATISCEPEGVLDMIHEGESVWFDDGRIGGLVEQVEPGRTLVRITSARPEGEKLRSGKGINLPDGELPLPALTGEDRVALAFAVEAADLVQFSFVRTPEDVHGLQDALAELGRPDLPVVLTIETRQGFERLPELLLAAMRSGPPSVMIARGDLAVECGPSRLSELQEEILWLCEAAHVPVIWATQVLERLAKEGRPSRAEITDAAMGERAECVMLNKGRHLPLAVRTLDDILRRMRQHQQKKRSMLRALRVAGPPREQAPVAA
ncbi:MAG TPA: pyruvate kinase [Polyangiales bacterium]